MWESLRRSLREYAAALWRWAWWLVFALIPALVEGYLWLTGKSAIIPTRAWITVGFIILVVGPFVVFHKLRQEREGLKHEIGELRDTRPKVFVSAEGFNLRVENKGGVADFEAKLRVLEVRNWPSLTLDDEFDAFWVKKRTDKATIIPDGHDRILLGGDGPKDGQPGKAVLSLFFFMLNFQTPNHASTEYYAHHPLYPLPSLRLRVTILTNPSAAVPIVGEATLTPAGVEITLSSAHA